MFTDQVHKMINDQIVEDHTHVFVFNYNGFHIDTESIRKLFENYDKLITSHELCNLFKSRAENHDVPKFLAGRYFDHALESLYKAYRRYDTKETLADIARRYYA